MSADGWNCCRRHRKSTADGLLAIRRVLYVGDGEYNLDSARQAIADALLLEERRFDDRDFYKFVVLNVMFNESPFLATGDHHSVVGLIFGRQVGGVEVVVRLSSQLGRRHLDSVGEVLVHSIDDFITIFHGRIQNGLARVNGRIQDHPSGWGKRDWGRGTYGLLRGLGTLVFVDSGDNFNTDRQSSARTKSEENRRFDDSYGFRNTINQVLLNDLPSATRFDHHAIVRLIFGRHFRGIEIIVGFADNLIRCGSKPAGKAIADPIEGFVEILDNDGN